MSIGEIILIVCCLGQTALAIYYRWCFDKSREANRKIIESRDLEKAMLDAIRRMGDEPPVESKTETNNTEWRPQMLKDPHICYRCDNIRWRNGDLSADGKCYIEEEVCQFGCSMQEAKETGDCRSFYPENIKDAVQWLKGRMTKLEKRMDALEGNR